MRVANPQQTVMIATMFLVANVANAIYVSLHVHPSAAFYLLYYVGVAWGFAAWIEADSKRLSRTIPIDAGWFSFIAWPLLIPYHLLSTRGIRGVLGILGFFGIFIAAYAVSLLVYFSLEAFK